jgi:hypothetical protein
MADRPTAPAFAKAYAVAKAMADMMADKTGATVIFAASWLCA